MASCIYAPTERQRGVLVSDKRGGAFPEYGRVDPLFNSALSTDAPSIFLIERNIPSSWTSASKETAGISNSAIQSYSNPLDREIAGAKQGDVGSCVERLLYRLV